jgi:hypothetical protein
MGKLPGIRGYALGAQGGPIARHVQEAQLIAYASQLSLAREPGGPWGMESARGGNGKGNGEWRNGTRPRSKEIRGPTI